MGKGENSGKENEEELERCSSSIWGSRTLKTMSVNGKWSSTKNRKCSGEL